MKASFLPHRGESMTAIAVMASLAASALWSASALAQADPTSPPAIDWQTEVVHLRADSMALEANDLVFSTVGAPLGYGSDPGGPDYWTLEVDWTEHGVDQRLNIYFGSDGTDWWVDEVRTYDGYPEGEWIYYQAPMPRAPLGEPVLGDVRLEGMGTGRPQSDLKVPGVLTISGMTLAVSPRSLDRMYAHPPGPAAIRGGDRPIRAGAAAPLQWHPPARSRGRAPADPRRGVPRLVSADASDQAGRCTARPARGHHRVDGARQPRRDRRVRE